jgi:predicted nuclease with RNAse H fold
MVAGIDLAAGGGTTEVALLKLVDGAALPIFRAQAHRAVTSDEEIVEVLAGARPTVIAIDAPLTLPRVVVNAVRRDGRAKDTSARHLHASASSPYTRQAERDPIWAELGLRPLPVSFLGGLTFRAIALVPELRALLPESAVIEVFPTATLRALGIRPAVEGTRREAKTSAAARAATQQGLSRYIDGPPSPASEPLSADLLDALAAALTAVAYHKGQFRAIGEADEGQIVLPSPDFAEAQIPAVHCQGIAAEG